MCKSGEIRIQNVLAKIRRGESVTIATLGGSITTGYCSNPIGEKSWAAQTKNWFENIAKKIWCQNKFLK